MARVFSSLSPAAGERAGSGGRTTRESPSGIVQARSVEVAGGEAAGLDLPPFRLLALALGHGSGTAGVKAAPGGWIRRIGYFARQDDPLPPRRGMEGKGRGQKRLRVGMQRLGVDGVALPGFYDLARVHDG